MRWYNDRSDDLQTRSANSDVIVSYENAFGRINYCAVDRRRLSRKNCESSNLNCTRVKVYIKWKWNFFFSIRDDKSEENRHENPSRDTRPVSGNGNERLPGDNVCFSFFRMIMVRVSNNFGRQVIEFWGGKNSTNAMGEIPVLVLVSTILTTPRYGVVLIW